MKRNCVWVIEKWNNNCNRWQIYSMHSTRIYARNALADFRYIKRLSNRQNAYRITQYIPNIYWKK